MMGGLVMSKSTREDEMQSELQHLYHLCSAVYWWMKKHKVKQGDFGKKINCSQTSISKYLNCIVEKEGRYYKNSGKYPLFSYEIACQWCEVMGTSVGNVLYEYEKNNNGSSKCTNKAGIQSLESYSTGSADYSDHSLIYSSEDKLINDINHPLFKSWFGTYHTVFPSTSSKENKYFWGTLKVLEHSDDGLCHVEFEFVSNRKKQKVKKYVGILTLTIQAAYITLEDSVHEGEISYLLLHNPDLKTTINVSCCLALVLTFSSQRGKRRPCCERMFISRFEIDEKSEQFDLIKSQLLMNDKFIYISENSYQEFIESITEESDEVLKKFKEMYPSIASFPTTHNRIERCIQIQEKWLLADCPKTKGKDGIELQDMV